MVRLCTKHPHAPTSLVATECLTYLHTYMATHHPSIHLSWMVCWGQWWWVLVPSLAMLRSYTVKLNSHVVGRNLTYLTHKNHYHHLGIYLDLHPLFGHYKQFQKTRWFPLAKYDLDDNTHMSPLGHKCVSLD
jgi:hypothetical protein